MLKYLLSITQYLACVLSPWEWSSDRNQELFHDPNESAREMWVFWVRVTFFEFVSLFLSAGLHHMARLSEYLCSSSTDFSACSQAHSAERLADGLCQRLVIFTGGAMHVYLNTLVFTFQKGWLSLLKKSF